MTLFEELKSSTKPSHDELESSLDLLSPQVTLEDYKNVLKKFWGVYAVIEKNVENSELSDEYRERKKLPLIEKDLSALGFSKNEIDELPTCEELKRVQSLPDLIGTLYVLEGSTLGAMILSKHFHLRFNLDYLNGLAFFTGNGENTFKKWKEWREISENIANLEVLENSQIIAQANKTFTTLKSWMCSQ